MNPEANAVVECVKREVLFAYEFWTAYGSQNKKDDHEHEGGRKAINHPWTSIKKSYYHNDSNFINTENEGYVRNKCI